jgi:hypothetical protein
MRGRPSPTDAALAGCGLLGAVVTVVTSFSVQPYEARGPANAPLFTYAATAAFLLPVLFAALRMAGRRLPPLPTDRSWAEVLAGVAAFCGANAVLIRVVGEGSTAGLVFGLGACAGLLLGARLLHRERVPASPEVGTPVAPPGHPLPPTSTS